MGNRNNFDWETQSYGCMFYLLIVMLAAPFVYLYKVISEHWDDSPMLRIIVYVVVVLLYASFFYYASK
jgi:Ca2+/H+ antiporter